MQTLKKIRGRLKDKRKDTYTSRNLISYSKHKTLSKIQYYKFLLETTNLFIDKQVINPLCWIIFYLFIPQNLNTSWSFEMKYLNFISKFSCAFSFIIKIDFTAVYHHSINNFTFLKGQCWIEKSICFYFSI